MPLDLLAIETFTWTPHIETTGEVCITEALEGREVAFAFLDVDNQDDELPAIYRLFGARKQRKAATLAQLLGSHGVRIIAAPKLSSRTRRDIRTFASQVPAHIDELKTLRYKGADLGLGVASSLISRTGSSAPDLPEWRKAVFRYLKAAATVFEQARLLIEREQPRSVLVFNGRFASTKSIVEAARLLRVQCLFHERGATLDRYKVQDEPVHDLADTRKRILEAWQKTGEDREILARAFYERRRQGDGIGWVSHVSHQRKDRIPGRQRPRRFVYFSSSDDEYAAVGDLVTHHLFASQRDAIDFLVNWVKGKADTELVIRVHPHMRAKSDRDRAWWHGFKGDNVTVERADSETDSYALAQSADVVITYGSTMGIEAAYMGKPVILLGDSAYRGMDCAYEPTDKEELVGLLSSAISARTQAACLPFGYYFLTHGTPYRFYEPTSLFTGRFMGVKLSAEPQLVRRFKGSAAGIALRRAKSRMLDRIPFMRPLYRLIMKALLGA